MKEKIWRPLPFDVTQFDRMESWLEDMVQKGWLLTDEILPLLVQFQRSEPRHRRYRIIPVTDRIASGAEEDEVELYETYGWTHVYQRRGMEIFCTDYPNAEELFTDAASFQMRAKRHLLGHGLAILVIALLFLWIIRSLLNLAGPMRTEPLHLLHYMGGTFAISLLICTIVALVSSVLNFTRYYRFLEKLKSGEGFSHDAPYRRVLTFNRAWMVISFLSIFALLIGIKVSHDFPYTRLSSADNGTYDLTHPLPLSAWDPDVWAKIEPCLETNRWTENMYYIEDRYRDILFSDIQMIDAGADGMRYFATWYEARSESIAENYLIEELPRDAEPFELDGADDAAILPGFYPKLYLRTGNRLLIVLTDERVDLKAAAPKLLSNLIQ